MRYFPAFLDIEAEPVLLVGGGETAARKLRLLLKAGAAVTVVAAEAVEEIAQLARDGAVVWRRLGFRAGDVEGRRAVWAAAEDDEADRRVAEAAKAAGIPVNVVDRPDLSTFIVPAIVDRDPVVIGISSGGTAPVLARRLRARIESLVPAGQGRLARFAEAFRGAVEAKVPDFSARRALWEWSSTAPSPRRSSTATRAARASAWSTWSTAIREPTTAA